jgi:predicted patatin/cPLA2 family phospholipase
VLSGGGDKGSYQASAFITWTKIVQKIDLSYDVIAGVSVGSLNGSGLAAYEPGDETNAAEWIYGVWHDLSNNDVFSSWPGGILEGIFEEQGIFDNTNLINFFKNRLSDKQIKKKITIGTADMNSARFISFNYNATNLTDQYVNHVIASTAMPLAFPALLEKNLTLLDGGVVWKMDVPGAIQRCLEVVDNEEDIIMDIIMTAQTEIESVSDMKKYSTLEHFLRGQEIKEFHKAMKVLNNTIIAHPRVNFRYVLAPSVPLTISPIPLDFSQKHLEFCFAVGEKDAKAAFDLGPGGYMNLLLDYTKRITEGEKLKFDNLLTQKLQEVGKKEKLVSE